MVVLLSEKFVITSHSHEFTYQTFLGLCGPAIDAGNEQLICNAYTHSTIWFYPPSERYGAGIQPWWTTQKDVCE